MSAILLVDDSKRILANTAKQLKQAGYEFEYVNDHAQASTFLRLNRTKVKIVIVALDNSLSYPSVRKLNTSLTTGATLVLCNSTGDATIANWAKKIGVANFFNPVSQQDELQKTIKRLMYKKGSFFTDQQLSYLSRTLGKYIENADTIVKETAPSTKSIQELQHKLARRLEGIESQKRFLSEVQS